MAGGAASMHHTLPDDQRLGVTSLNICLAAANTPKPPSCGFSSQGAASSA